MSIQKKYINFSFILGGILLLCVSFLYVLSSLNENGSTIVNIAGKQRMLVLRFGKLIIQAKTLNDSSKNLQEDIYSVEQELNSNHNKIIDYLSNHSGSDKILQDQKKLTPLLNNLLNFSDCKGCSLKSLDPMTEDFLVKMNSIVNDLDTHLNDRVILIENIVLVMTLFILIFLLFTYIKVILPGEQTLDDAKSFAQIKHEKFEATFNNAPLGMFLVSSDGQVLEMNDNACSIFECSSKEMLNKPISLLIPNYESLLKIKWCPLSPDNSRKELLISRNDNSGLTKNNKKIDLDINFSQINEFFIIMIKDITVIKQERKIAEINSHMATIGTSVAGFAHEVMNPLTIIKMNMYTLKKKIADNNELKRIENSLERISELVADLNNYSKSCSTSTSNEIVSIDNIIKISKSLTVMDTKYVAKISTDIPTNENLNIFVNEGKMTQVLINLIRNSAQSLDESNIDTNFIKISAFKENDHVVLTVKDNGKGIKEENFENIFKEYFSTKDKETGTGLGLSIVKKIIDGFNGTISVESEYGSGATFIIKLPIAKEQVQTSKEIIKAA